MGWIRQVMNEETWGLVSQLPVSEMSALEVSGKRWSTMGFKSYRTAWINELDLDVARLDEQFDIVLAEQVWEHLKYPYRAGRNAYDMVRPGGHLLITTPFLIRRHDDPIDCTRWTALGLKYYLTELGFEQEKIYTNSWGNLGAVIGNLTQWTPYNPSHNAAHKLENDPLYPVVVWGMAQKGR